MNNALNVEINGSLRFNEIRQVREQISMRYR